MLYMISNLTSAKMKMSEYQSFAKSILSLLDRHRVSGGRSHMCTAYGNHGPMVSTVNTTQVIQINMFICSTY